MASSSARSTSVGTVATSVRRSRRRRRISRSASASGIADADAQQEAVELRLRQRIGALQLDRDSGWRSPGTAGSSGNDWPSIVTCDSCMASSSAACVLGVARLISSASSRLVKTGPAPELEAALALVVEEAAGDVARQQVGRELDAPEAEVERLGQEPGDQGLGEARVVLDRARGRWPGCRPGSARARRPCPPRSGRASPPPRGPAPRRRDLHRPPACSMAAITRRRLARLGPAPGRAPGAAAAAAPARSAAATAPCRNSGGCGARCARRWPGRRK